MTNFTQILNTKVFKKILKDHIKYLFPMSPLNLIVVSISLKDDELKFFSSNGYRILMSVLEVDNPEKKIIDNMNIHFDDLIDVDLKKGDFLLELDLDKNFLIIEQEKIYKLPVIKNKYPSTDFIEKIPYEENYKEISFDKKYLADIASLEGNIVTIKFDTSANGHESQTYFIGNSTQFEHSNLKQVVVIMPYLISKKKEEK